MCKFCDRSEELCTCHRSGRLEPSTSGFQEQQSDFKFQCRLTCCKCSYCHRVATKERRKSHLLSNLHRNKICEKCFLCRSLVFCRSCHQCPTCCYRSSCRGEVKTVLAKMGVLGFKSKSGKHTEGGLHSPLPVPTVISNYHNPTKQSFLVEALYQLINKNAVEPVENQNSLGFYNRLFLLPKPNNRWRPILDLSTLNTFLNTESFKMETPETIRTSLQAGEWVTSIDFKDAYFHIPIQSRKYMRFHLQGWSYQFKALPFGLSTAPMEFTVVARGQTHGTSEGYKDPLVPRQLAGESLYPQHLSPAYSNPGHTLSGTRVAGEQGKIRTGPQTGLQLCRLPVRLERGQGQTNRRTLADLDRQESKFQFN